MGVGDKLYDDEVSGFFVVRGKQGWSFRAHADLPTRVMRERLTGAPTIVVTIGRFPSTSIKHARTDDGVEGGVGKRQRGDIGLLHIV